MIKLFDREYLTEKEASAIYPYSIKWFQEKRQGKKKGLSCPPFIQIHERGKVFYPVIDLENWFKKKVAENE